MDYMQYPGIKTIINAINRYFPQVKVSDPGTRGSNGHGYFDYKHNKFVMPDGR